jgi:hypothetical protein
MSETTNQQPAVQRAVTRLRQEAANGPSAARPPAILAAITDAGDAAIVKLAAANLTAYDARTGLKSGDQGTWDMVQAAKLAVDLRAALDIIERLTRPAGRHTIEAHDEGTSYCTSLPPHQPCDSV